jgi:phosphatidylserine decarboxylase
MKDILEKTEAVIEKELFKDISWLPLSKEATADYMNALREIIDIVEDKHLGLKSAPIIDLHPVMQEFQDLIYNDSLIRMNFTKMIDQVPSYYKEKDKDGKYIHGYYLQSIEEMIRLINHILKTAPEYNDTELVGFPINTILNWTMGVPAGAAAFRDVKTNNMFRKVLAVWTEYLDSEESLYVFKYVPEESEENSTSWLCKKSLAKLKMEQYLEPEALKVFKKGYKKGQPYPYTSWNDFFIRVFKNDKQRPINPTKNGIVSACDSTVYNIQHNARLQDWFWLKTQPYSLSDMLANETGDMQGAEKIESDKEHFDNYVKPFDGGTVYQAFLSAFKYHRWNSPVDGIVKKAYVKEGTYYSATQSEGMDQGSPDLSQGYIAHTATRAIIYIEATDPDIGLMCVMPIGMSEVSSCIITVNEGDPVKKGTELGYFQFGGSTHCLIFQEGVVDKFLVKKEEEVNMGSLICEGQPVSQQK